MSENRISSNIQPVAQALENMLGCAVTSFTHNAIPLQGGTLGEVMMLTGTAQTDEGEKPFSLVRKKQKKWQRYADPLSWRREYDLYSGALGQFFLQELCWPDCYHALITENETELFLAYIEGVSGAALTPALLARASYQLGRLQGKTAVHAGELSLALHTGNVNNRDFLKQNYLHYRHWPEVADCIRRPDCALDTYLCNELITQDLKAEETFARLEKLPPVFCHKDFWVTNIFFCGEKTLLIDWDTAGWGYPGEDIASLLADELALELLPACYSSCIPAYCEGFSEFYPLSPAMLPVREMMLLKFGYRLTEDFLFCKTEEGRTRAKKSLQAICNLA